MKCFRTEIERFAQDTTSQQIIYTYVCVCMEHALLLEFHPLKALVVTNKRLSSSFTTRVTPNLTTLDE